MTKEERNAALIPRIKGAMSLGLEVLDAAFEKIYVNEANSESEDEDSMNPSDAILEPKVRCTVDIARNSNKIYLYTTYLKLLTPLTLPKCRLLCEVDYESMPSFPIFRCSL